MSKRNEVELFVRRQIKNISFLSPPKAGAVLANLRRGLGKKPGEIPDIWEWELESLDEKTSKAAGPTKMEWAVHIALTLFAYHQQSRDVKDNCVSQDGIRFGTAVSKLAADDIARERILKQLKTAAGSDTPELLQSHLRHMTALFRNAGIAIDYPTLAGDIYEMQFPDGRKKVLLQWGRDFEITSKVNDNKEEDYE